MRAYFVWWHFINIIFNARLYDELKGGEDGRNSCAIEWVIAFQKMPVKFEIHSLLKLAKEDFFFEAALIFQAGHIPHWA